LDAEERKLQIKLAQLNTRIQIYIASAFGLVALGGGCAIGCYQLFSSTPKGFSVESIPFFGLAALGLISILAASYFVNKLFNCKEEIDSLK
jgi:hypothetical protein